MEGSASHNSLPPEGMSWMMPEFQCKIGIWIICRSVSMLFRFDRIESNTHSNDFLRCKFTILAWILPLGIGSPLHLIWIIFELSSIKKKRASARVHRRRIINQRKSCARNPTTSDAKFKIRIPKQADYLFASSLFEIAITTGAAAATTTTTTTTTWRCKEKSIRFRPHLLGNFQWESWTDRWINVAIC